MELPLATSLKPRQNPITIIVGDLSVIVPDSTRRGKNIPTVNITTHYSITRKTQAYNYLTNGKAPASVVVAVAAPVASATMSLSNLSPVASMATSSSNHSSRTPPPPSTQHCLHSGSSRHRELHSQPAMDLRPRSPNPHPHPRHLLGPPPRHSPHPRPLHCPLFAPYFVSHRRG